MNLSARTIQGILDERDMSWSQLARKADLSQPTIYKLRNYEGNVTLRTLQKVAGALDCTVSDLLGEEPANSCQRESKRVRKGADE